jgi:hypothetical protein
VARIRPVVCFTTAEVRFSYFAESALCLQRCSGLVSHRLSPNQADERALSRYADVEEFAGSSEVPDDCLALSIGPGENASDRQYASKPLMAR